MDMLVELKCFESQVLDGESPGQKTKIFKGSLQKFGPKSAKMQNVSKALKRPEGSESTLNKSKIGGRCALSVIFSKKTLKVRDF